MNESSGIFSIIKGINLNKVLNTANRTLNFVNKAIPMYKEFKPTINNLRNTFSKEKKEEIPIDEIKESRPIKINKNISPTNYSERNINDTLTFFQ